MSGRIITIDPNGVETTIPVSRRGGPALETLQAAVGGYIETVKVRYDGRIRDAYVNEDGIALQLPYNERASALSVHHTLFGTLAIWIPTPKVKK